MAQTFIVLETDNVFGTQRSYLVNEDASKFMTEAVRTDRNKALVKSRITTTVGNVDETSESIEPTETRDFFAEGVEFDPATGLDSSPSLDVQSLGNKNL